MAAALLRRDRNRVPARSAARVARGALPWPHAPSLARRVPAGACGRSARRGRGARPRSRGSVDRSDGTERRDARLHGARADALPCDKSGDVRRVLTVAHGRRPLLKRRPHPGGAVNDRALQDDVIRALADAPYRASAEWRARPLPHPPRGGGDRSGGRRVGEEGGIRWGAAYLKKKKKTFLRSLSLILTLLFDRVVVA